MTTIAKCTNCDSAFKVKDHLVGKAVRCPRCGEAFRVEANRGKSISSSKLSSAGSKSARPITQSTSVDPVASETLAAAPTAEGFFDTAEDPDAIYGAHVVSAQKRKRQRQLVLLLASGGLAGVLLLVGAIVAFQYVYDNADIPLELADPKSINVEELAGNWRPYGDTHWGYSLRMPGEAEVGTDKDEQIRALSLSEGRFGLMKFEIRKESHPEWNEYFAKLERDEIFQGVPAANVMKISSDVTYRTDSIAVHRYILVSKDTRLTKNVAVVHKFSVEGRTITAMWSGKREMLRSPEVLYFFSSIEVSGNRYITH